MAYCRRYKCRKCLNWIKQENKDEEKQLCCENCLNSKGVITNIVSKPVQPKFDKPLILKGRPRAF